MIQMIIFTNTKTAFEAKKSRTFIRRICNHMKRKFPSQSVSAEETLSSKKRNLEQELSQTVYLVYLDGIITEFTGFWEGLGHSENFSFVSHVNFLGDFEKLSFVSHVNFLGDSEKLSFVSHVNFLGDSEKLSFVSHVNFLGHSEKLSFVYHVNFLGDFEKLSFVSHVYFLGHSENRIRLL